MTEEAPQQPEQQQQQQIPKSVTSTVPLKYKDDTESTNIFETKAYYPKEQRDVLIILVHGFGSHSGRTPLDVLVKQGYSVYVYDQRGHGRTKPQPRGYVDIPVFTEDLRKLITTRAEVDTFKNVFVLGHSMGGLVVLSSDISYGLQKVIKNCRGVITTGAALKLAPETDNFFLRKVVTFVGWILPTATVHTVPSEFISRDPKVNKAYADDPLVYPKMSAKHGVNFMKAQIAFDSTKLQCTNLLMMHGESDKLITPESSTMVRDEAKHIKDMTCKLYKDFYHEIMNEPNNGQIWKDMFEWIEKRKQ